MEKGGTINDKCTNTKEMKKTFSGIKII